MNNLSKITHHLSPPPMNSINKEENDVLNLLEIAISQFSCNSKPHFELTMGKLLDYNFTPFLPKFWEADHNFQIKSMLLLKIAEFSLQVLQKTYAGFETLKFLCQQCTFSDKKGEVEVWLQIKKILSTTSHQEKLLPLFNKLKPDLQDYLIKESKINNKKIKKKHLNSFLALPDKLSSEEFLFTNYLIAYVHSHKIHKFTESFRKHLFEEITIILEKDLSHYKFFHNFTLYRSSLQERTSDLFLKLFQHYIKKNPQIKHLENLLKIFHKNHWVNQETLEQALDKTHQEETVRNLILQYMPNPDEEFKESLTRTSSLSELQFQFDDLSINEDVR